MMAVGTRLAIWMRSRTAFWKRSSALSKKRRSSTWSMQNTMRRAIDGPHQLAESFR